MPNATQQLSFCKGKENEPKHWHIKHVKEGADERNKDGPGGPKPKLELINDALAMNGALLPGHTSGSLRMNGRNSSSCFVGKDGMASSSSSSSLPRPF